MAKGPSDSKPQGVVRKKLVKAYPFAATLDQAGVKKPIEVIYVSELGVIANVRNLILRVGSFYMLQFELPVLGHFVLTEGRVLKTYDKAHDGKGHAVDRLAEFHFTKLTEEHRERIKLFVKAIRKK